MRTWQAAIIAGVFGTFSVYAADNTSVKLDDVLTHFTNQGFKVEGITRISDEMVPKDGFDTVEMVKVDWQDPKTMEVQYSFRLWRQKTIEQAQRRLKMGKAFKWEMIAAGTIVLEWMEGTASNKERIYKLFEDFRTKNKLAAMTDK